MVPLLTAKFLEGNKKDWKSFNKTIETDELHLWYRDYENEE
jgi:hypothetical protein